MFINLLTDDPYKHIQALCKRAHILQISERAIFRYKDKNDNNQIIYRRL